MTYSTQVVKSSDHHKVSPRELVYVQQTQNFSKSTEPKLPHSAILGIRAFHVVPGVVVTRTHINGENNIDWASLLLGLGRGTAWFFTLAHTTIQGVLSSGVTWLLFIAFLRWKYTSSKKFFINSKSLENLRALFLIDYILGQFYIGRWC